MKRAFLNILDGCGVGEMPDAHLYNDQGSNTLGNLADVLNGLTLPHLEELGLGKIIPIRGLSSDVPALGAFGKMAETSPGKDSTTGHWELAGIHLEHPFPTYPEGFPPEIIQAFKQHTGYDVLCNKPASGTEVIRELGEEHLATGKPIVYTSADSVFQIAAHESVISLAELYSLCETARKILTGKHAVARVIARPFTGKNAESFVRTKYRKDFSLKPVTRTIHQILQENGIPTYGIGKIDDLYAGVGLEKTVATKQNSEGMNALLEAAERQESGLIMVNLVDFDMLWGHRNDVEGFGKGLEEFDVWLPELTGRMTKEDILVITADHGNDPTTPGTDHSREYVPVIIYGETVRRNRNIGVRRSFADLSATLADYFEVPSTGVGTSFLSEIS